MKDSILLDTGVIVALLDRSEKKHKKCVAAVSKLQGTLLTCEAVIAEACYLLRAVEGAPAAILENVQRGVFHLPWRLKGSEQSVIQLQKKYSDVPMDFADACLVVMAEVFNVARILTLDSDFNTYRWSGRKTFQILVG